jgi:hypothetical protein
MSLGEFFCLWGAIPFLILHHIITDPADPIEVRTHRIK